jgi:tellurite resistance protein
MEILIFFAVVAWIMMGIFDKDKPSTDNYFGPPQFKFVDEHNKELNLLVKNIMFRGKIPVQNSTDLSFAISILERAPNDEFKPVISMYNGTQETETTSFSQTGELGKVNEGSSFVSWVKLGVIIPSFLQASHSGNRDLVMVARFFDKTNPPSITAGFKLLNNDLILSSELDFSHNFTEKGYEEETADREKSQVIALKFGVAVAMADGTLDDAEGEVLKKWILKQVKPFSETRQTRLKTMFNNALKEGFSDAKKGKLLLSDLTKRLNSINEKKSQYAAIELCLDVMAADGVADPEELLTIRKIAESLNLDMDEVEKMREKVTLNLSTELTSDEGMEQLFGIDDAWSKEKKQKHLRKEFQKWNNRLSSLPEGDERQSAQSMLDNIAKLRKKYG